MKNIQSGIHPTALVGDRVKIGKNVTIGPGAVIYDDVEIGSGSTIGAQVILGEPTADIYLNSLCYTNKPLRIGVNSLVRSGSILYAGSVFGDRLETGHRVTIREGVVAGENLRVGTLSDLQGAVVIGDYVRMHSNVHIGRGSKIGSYVWIFPYVVLTNDPHPPSNFLCGVTVEDFAVIATMSVILPGVTLGKDCLIGAGSIVNRSVEQEDVVVGNPAKRVASVRDIRNKVTGAAVYPWREHFDRGMPWEDVGFDEWTSRQ